MSIWAWDTETMKKNPINGEWEYVLDASGNNFVLGCIVKDSGGKKSFTDKDIMWNYIIESGKKEYKRGKILRIYGHNAKYEFYQVANLNDKNLKIFSENPFIAGYYQEIEKEFLTEEEFRSWEKWANMNGQYFKIKSKFLGITTISYKKEIIKFLDTMSLFHMSLEKLGKIINVPKMEMPEKFGKKMTKMKLKELEKYCINDCKVSLESVNFLKNKLKEEGIVIKNLCTINQIAINYVISKLMKGNNEHILIKNKDGKLTEKTWKSYFPEDIHQAYRGGYVRVWKTGEINNVTDIDFNSLYPYSAMNMKFPDLRTEVKIKEPLKKYNINELLNKIGISKCIIHNKDDELGLLLVRCDGKSYVFGKGKYAIGTWTNIELKEAINNGYEILNIEWSIIYEESINPFKEIFGRVYNLRKKSDNKFDDYFYKMIMNASIGKFAQTKTNQEILVDSIEMIYEYLEKGYKKLGDIENSANVVYINRNMNKGQMKKYYSPIISCLITANARVIMYNNFKKIKREDLVYTDTDSCIFTGDYLDKFKIGSEIGMFKIEKDVVSDKPLINTKAIIWGTKCKMIGNNIGVSGVFKSDLTKEDFEKGKVYAKKMMGIKNNREQEVGSFIVEERDLKKQLEEFNKVEELLGSQKLYIDKGIEDITFFTNDLIKLSVLHLSPINSNT